MLVSRHVCWLVMSVFAFQYQEWNYMRGGLSTIDRDYGWFNNIHHDIGTHVVHHLFPQIPHYNLIEAVCISYLSVLLTSLFLLWKYSAYIVSQSSRYSRMVHHHAHHLFELYIITWDIGDARDIIGHQDAVLLYSRMWDSYHLVMRSWHKLFGVVVDGSNQACPGWVLQGPQKIRSHSHTSRRASSYKLETGSLCFRQWWYRFLSNRSHIFTFQSSACFWENPINMYG